MPTNEEGEFELVLGNKQLLSVFFVAVLLLGVFFIMGYIVGRNLSPEPALVAEGPRGTGVIDVDSATPPPAPVKPAVVPTPDPEKPAAMPEAAGVTPKPVEVPKPVAAKPVETPKPIAAAPKPVEAPKKAEAKPPVKPVEAPKKAEAKPVPPKPVEAPKPAPVAAAKGPAAGGRYWQVAAALPGKVDSVVSGLKAKGFSVTTQPVPGQELVRVLVGPYDAATAADGAAKLKAAGYAAIPKKL